MRRERDNGPPGGSSNLAKKVRVREAKKEKTALAVTKPVVGQIKQIKALATRLSEFHTTVWLASKYEVLTASPKVANR